MSQSDLIGTRIRALPIWQGEIAAVDPLTGGITNVNYKVEDSGRSYVVRVGDDIPLHQVHALQRAGRQPRRPCGRPLARSAVHSEPER